MNTRLIPRHGATLLEILIAIAIVALLVTLLLPSFGRIRLAANDARSKHNLHQHLVAFSAYSTDWKDFFPAFTYPGPSLTVLRVPGMTISIPYFAHKNTWNLPLASLYYEGNCLSESFYAPGVLESGLARGVHPVFTSYLYTSTCLASHGFWNSTTREGPSQWRAIKTVDVRDPVRKGILIGPSSDEDSPFTAVEVEEHERPIGFADGHARSYPRSKLTAPYPGGEGIWPGTTWGIGQPVIHTIDGVRGRDVE